MMFGTVFRPVSLARIACTWGPSERTFNSIIFGDGVMLYEVNRSFALLEYLAHDPVKLITTGPRRPEHSRAIRLAEHHERILLLQLLQMVIPLIVPVRLVHLQINGVRWIDLHAPETLDADRAAVLVQLALRMGGDEVQERVDLPHVSGGLGLRDAARARGVG